MASREHFLKQAETCLRLAVQTTDPDLALKLQELAAEYRQKADEAEPDRKPQA
jgi:hypothetical protein